MHPDRTMLRGWLIKPPKPPFVICAAVSGQKWLHIRAEVALAPQEGGRSGGYYGLYPVQFEDTRIYVDKVLLQEYLEAVETLYSNGFSKAEIESGNYNQKRIIDYGLKRWQKIENYLSDCRRTTARLFSLAVFVAREQEDLKIRKEDNKCQESFVTDSEPRTGPKQQALF